MGYMMDKAIQMIAGKRTELISHTSRNHTNPSMSGSNTHRLDSTNTSNAHSRTSSTSSASTNVSACSVSSFTLEPPSARHVPTTIDLLFPQLDSRNDITPEVKAQVVEIKAHRPKTWEQRMLEKSRERYRILMERQGELREEERMIDWGMLGWRQERGW
ncbi:MAG: hypothetical protein Q9188_007329 [Gyalolechia gomerana]